MNPIDQQAKQVDTLLNELTAHHWDTAVDSFGSETPSYEDVSANIRLQGKSGIASGIAALATALPDLAIRVVHASDVPGYSVREVIVTGTHLGTYQGIEPSGQPVRFACACIFEFDAKGRLATERLYFDNQTLLQQMHGKPQMYLPASLRIAA